MYRYFFTILATKHPEYTKQLILHSRKLRFDSVDEEAQKERIDIDEDWEKELKEFPQFAREYLRFSIA